MGMTNANANLKIREAKRKNEKYILDRFRKNPNASTTLFCMPLYNALDRLEAAGAILYRPATRTHTVRKYARPVS